MGSVAAEPSKWLSQDQYWFVESGASTSTTEDGEPVVITSRTLDAGDTIAYCTFNTAKTTSGYDDDWNECQMLDFISEDTIKGADIPSSGFFVKMKAKFTPRETPQVSASKDFPYRTLLYVTQDNHLAFLEREGEKCAAKEVVTQTVVTKNEETQEDEPLEITVQILYANEESTFRVYVNTSEGWAEVVAQGESEARAYRSLQDGKTGRYYAEYLHSFAFTGSVELSAIAFTTEVPDWMEEMNSIPFEFKPSNAVKEIALKEMNGEEEGEALTEWSVTRSKTYKVSFKADTTQYVYGEPSFAGNIAKDVNYVSPAADSQEAVGTITFTVADILTNGSKLVLTLPSKAYFFTVDGEKYGTFAEVIAAASKSAKPISLTHDINLAGSVSPGPQAVINRNQSIVLDLNGKTINGLDLDTDTVDDAAIVNHGSLKIVDSDPEKKGKVMAKGYVLSSPELEDMYALRNSANETIIKAGTFCGIVTNVTGRIQIDGGRFLKVFDDDTATDFYLHRQAGVSIGARFDNANFTTVEGVTGQFWTGDESTDLIEFRVDTPSYATLSQKLYSKADYEGGSCPTVTAAGYDVSAEKIVWKQDSDDASIVRGELKAITYDITYDTDGKADYPTSAPDTYTVDAEELALPVLENAHWDFKGWYAEGKEVVSLGEFATYVGTEGALPEGLIYGDLTLVAKWEPKTFSWTNAKKGKDYRRMSEVNGYYAAEEGVDYSWNLSIPSEMNGFVRDDLICLESITLSTVNASPNNLARTAPALKLSIDGTDYVATREDFVEKAAAQDKFEPSLYFETNFGFRPKIVYAFGDEKKPTIKVGTTYLDSLSLVNESKTDVLMRLVKKTDDEKLDVIGVSSPLPSSSLDYQSYVPMFEIIGKAADANEGAE